jgi:hypothetical protein
MQNVDLLSTISVSSRTTYFHPHILIYSGSLLFSSPPDFLQIYILMISKGFTQ